jgi:hypothetical protein
MVALRTGEAIAPHNPQSKVLSQLKSLEFAKLCPNYQLIECLKSLPRILVLLSLNQLQLLVGVVWRDYKFHRYVRQFQAVY